jgi:two-component system NtrC family sensor kinase
MTFFYFLAAFLLIRRLMKRLKFSPLYPKWRAMLSTANWVIIVMYFSMAFTLEDEAVTLLGSAILLCMLLYVEREPDFNSQKAYVKANYPLVVVGFINGLTQIIASKFYYKCHNYF